MKEFSRLVKQQKVSHPPKKKTKFPQTKLLNVLGLGFTIGAVLLVLLLLIHFPGYLDKKLAPRSIEVKGNDIVSEDKIIKLLKIGTDDSWFDLDPYLMSLNLKNNIWIDHALVHRVLPFKIRVFIEERQPLAYLKTKNGLFLLGKELLVLNPIPPRESWNLPVIIDLKLEGIKTGTILDETQIKPALVLMKRLQNDSVLPMNRVSHIDISDPLNIQLITIPDHIRIKLGYDHYEQKLVTLYYAMSELAKERKRIRYIDLRYEHGLAISRK